MRQRLIHKTENQEQPKAVTFDTFARGSVSQNTIAEEAIPWNRYCSAQISVKTTGPKELNTTAKR